MSGKVEETLGVTFFLTDVLNVLLILPRSKRLSTGSCRTNLRSWLWAYPHLFPWRWLWHDFEISWDDTLTLTHVSDVSVKQFPSFSHRFSVQSSITSCDTKSRSWWTSRRVAWLSERSWRASRRGVRRSGQFGSAGTWVKWSCASKDGERLRYGEYHGNWWNMYDSYDCMTMLSSKHIKRNSVLFQNLSRLKFFVSTHSIPPFHNINNIYKYYIYIIYIYILYIFIYIYTSIHNPHSMHSMHSIFILWICWIGAHLRLWGAIRCHMVPLT